MPVITETKFQVRAYNASGAQLFLNGADVDSFMHRTFPNYREALNYVIAAPKTAFRWTDDGFKRNRVASFDIRPVDPTQGNIEPMSSESAAETLAWLNRAREIDAAPKEEETELLNEHNPDDIAPVRIPSDCIAAQGPQHWHARQFSAFWAICGEDVSRAETSDLKSPTCPDCIAIIREGRNYAMNPATPEPKRAKLRLSNAHVSLNHRGELVIIAEDALRGPVEITTNETDSRWLRACIADMGSLGDG